MTELTLVSDHLASLPRLYVFWTDIDLDAFIDIVEDAKGDYFVLNFNDIEPAEETDLRRHLQVMSQADWVMWPSTWWTSVLGHQLMQVAGWMGCKFLDYEGTPIEMVGAS